MQPIMPYLSSEKKAAFRSMHMSYDPLKYHRSSGLSRAVRRSMLPGNRLYVPTTTIHPRTDDVDIVETTWDELYPNKNHGNNIFPM